MSPAELVSHFLLLLLLLCLSAFLTASETSIFSLSALERRRISRFPYKSGKIITYLFENPRRTLVAILLGNNLANILFTAMATTIAYQWLGVRGVGVSIAFVTGVLIVFGDMVPKIIAVNRNEFFARLIAWPLHIFAQVMFPARVLVRKVTDVTLSLLVRDAAARGDQISEKELQVLIQIGQEEGILEKAEGKRLGRLFQLGDRSVKEIMTPRTDLIAFDIRGKRDALYHLLENYHYTYLPVFRDSPDQILGVISVQEVMLNSERALSEFLRPPYYVPETKKIDELLFEMRKNKLQFAICVDEFGGTSGLVTHEDIVEEIFGEIYDEYSKEEKLIKRLGRDEFLIDGRVSLKDLNEAVGARFRSPSSETLNGFILEKLGHLPKPKETVRLDDFLFEIREMEKRRIKKVVLRRLR